MDGIRRWEGQRGYRMMHVLVAIKRPVESGLLCAYALPPSRFFPVDKLDQALLTRNSAMSSDDKPQQGRSIRS